MSAMPDHEPVNSLHMHDSDALVHQYIQSNPHRPGADEVVLIPFGVPVWALIGAVTYTNATPEEVAQEYEIPLPAMYAALAYYHRNRAVIDARLRANDIGAA